MTLNILVIDDSEDDRRLYQRALKDVDCRLVMTPSAKAGFICMADLKPDVILLDYNLPDLDGLSFVKLLAGYSEAPPPIIMLTGEGSESVAVEVMKSGAEDYLAKDTAGQYLRLLPGVIARAVASNAQREQILRLQQETETLLRRNQELMRTSLDGIHVMDMDGNVVEANDAFCRMLGYTVEEMSRLNVADLDAQWSAEELRERFRELIGNSARLETVHRRKDGSLINVEISSSCMEIEGQHFVFAASRDITERKIASLALQRNQALLNEAQRLGKLGSWELDLLSDELHWSDEMYRIFELDPAQFSHSYEGFLNVIHPDDRDKVNQAYTQSLQDHQPYDVLHRLLFADGRIKWVHEHCTSEFDVSGKPLRSVGMAQDITEHQEAEAALLSGEANLRAMLDNSPYLTWLKDTGGRYISVNKVFSDYLRLEDASQVIGKTDLNLQPKELAEKHRADDAEVMAARQRKTIEESAFDGKNTLWMETSKTPIIDKQGNVLGTVGFARDITERKKAEEKILLESKAEHQRAEILAQQFGHLLQGSFNEIYLFDADSLHFLLTSEGAEKNLGYSDEELNQLTQLDINPSFTRESFERLIAPLRTGEQQSLLFESVHRRKDGTTYQVEVRLQLMQGDSPVFLAIIQDITERKRVEQQLRDLTAHLQTVREEEKAGIAREIHDDLGGTLTALKMETHQLETELSQDKNALPLLQHVESMSQLINAAAGITRQIITDLRPTILDDLGLLAAIEWQAAQFHKRTGIEYLVNCIEDKGHLDKRHSIALFRILQEALTNVARHSGASRVEIEFHHNDEEVVLSVSDNGRGLSDDRPVKTGSYGMLGMIERVEQLGGAIRFDIPPGGGLGVTVTVPLPAGEGRI